MGSGAGARFAAERQEEFDAVRRKVACLYLGDGVRALAVDGYVRETFPGVRRLTLARVESEGLLAVAGLESLVHLQLNFCRKEVTGALPEVLATLPGLRRLALIGCEGLDELFFAGLVEKAALLETLEIETHKSPSEPLCAGATAFLAMMPFLTTLRLLGEVQSFFDQAACFRGAAARLLCLDITATELLCAGSAGNVCALRGAARRLYKALGFLPDLRFIRLEGKVFPNYLPALGALPLLQVVDLGLTPQVVEFGLGKPGFSLFNETEEELKAHEALPEGKQDQLNEWYVSTCDTLRLHSPELHSKQFADLRQGFDRLRCLDLAYDRCYLIGGTKDSSGQVIARLICNFDRLEVLRMSMCKWTVADLLHSPSAVSEVASLAPNLSFLSQLKHARRLRCLRMDFLDLTAYTCEGSAVSYDSIAAGQDMGTFLSLIPCLQDFQVACPLTQIGYVKPADWSAMESVADSYAHGKTNSVFGRSNGAVTTNIFTDWSGLFCQGGVPEF
jgi:hypothetical protein